MAKFKYIPTKSQNIQVTKENAEKIDLGKILGSVDITSKPKVSLFIKYV